MQRAARGAGRGVSATPTSASVAPLEEQFALLKVELSDRLEHSQRMVESVSNENARLLKHVESLQRVQQQGTHPRSPSPPASPLASQSARSGDLRPPSSFPVAEQQAPESHASEIEAVRLQLTTKTAGAEWVIVIHTFCRFVVSILTGYL
jgi:hypothetical protein